MQTFVDASLKTPDRHAVHSNAPTSVSVFVSEFLGQVLEATVESDLYWPGLQAMHAIAVAFRPVFVTEPAAQTVKTLCP
jgi:hypothetical protein